jgi:hypothetical protein
MSDNVIYNPKSPLIPNSICSICHETFPCINGQLFVVAYVSFDKDGNVDRITGASPHTHSDIRFSNFEDVQ